MHHACHSRLQDAAVESCGFLTTIRDACGGCSLVAILGMGCAKQESVFTASGSTPCTILSLRHPESIMHPKHGCSSKYNDQESRADSQPQCWCSLKPRETPGYVANVYTMQNHHRQVLGKPVLLRCTFTQMQCLIRRLVYRDASATLHICWVDCRPAGLRQPDALLMQPLSRSLRGASLAQ